MHPTTKSVKCGFPGAQPESTCGSKRGVHHWVPLEVDTIRGWPKMGLKSGFRFKSCVARLKAVMDKGKEKGKSDVEPISQLGVSNAVRG